MKLSEIKGRKALTVLADIIEPASIIMKDDKVQEFAKGGKAADLAMYVLKEYPDEIIEIMAYTEGESPETYEPNILSIPRKLIEIFSDPELTSLFH